MIEASAGGGTAAATGDSHVLGFLVGPATGVADILGQRFWRCALPSDALGCPDALLSSWWENGKNGEESLDKPLKLSSSKQLLAERSPACPSLPFSCCDASCSATTGTTD